MSAQASVVYLRFQNQLSQPIPEKLIVLVIEEDFAPLDPSGNNMLENPRRIQAGLSRHEVYLP